jgi:hypothetical protein
MKIIQEDKMGKEITKDTVVIPKEEYGFLKELYKTVKRQSFLLRVNEAEENLKAGKVKKVSVDKFIESI